MSSNEKDEEMICALAAEEHAALQKGLRALPETMPPRDVWLRIREQAEAEGLVHHPANKRRWYAGVGLAAAAAMVAVVMTMQPTPTSDVVPQGDPSNTVNLDNLRALQVESAQLERDLRSLPAQPGVGRAGTVATIADIEERIAAIDYQLNDPEEQMSARDREVFWGERVRLMKLLLQLRYAQAQRAAF